ncbi:MAG TPA: DUF4082 domain-containing protein, partial [Clostridia bacterium]|nr:DUF4082 domain-containing protein [Clostridia bacterium]
PTVSIWANDTVPGNPDGGPDDPAEVGVKFQSDVAGRIRGIRFYKHIANTGTHVGNLWTINGSLLATITFTNESVSGWQEALFPTPVRINASATYVASYHAENGHYCADVNYFLASGIDNPPLHALSDPVADGNGIYAYGSRSVFPNCTWESANYWVDVVFEAGVEPTLMQIADQVVNEGELLVVTNTAIDSGLTNSVLNYLLVNAPDGAAIDREGVIRWKPKENQGPGNYRLITSAINSSSPGLSATNTFLVAVSEVNRPPVLPKQANRTIEALATLVVTNSATDLDVPENALTYALLAGPTNATISSDGVVTWTPTIEQDTQVYLFTTLVTDSSPLATNSVRLSATNSFEVLINALVPPVPTIQSCLVTNGIAALSWSTLSGHYYRLEYKENLTAAFWSNALPDLRAVGPTLAITNLVPGSKQRFYRVQIVK